MCFGHAEVFCEKPFLLYTSTSAKRCGAVTCRRAVSTNRATETVNDTIGDSISLTPSQPVTLISSQIAGLRQIIESLPWLLHVKSNCLILIASVIK